MKNYSLITIFLIFLSGCSAFNKPFTMDMRVPDGPPEFQAGWHDGCSSALSTLNFGNARFMPLTLGSGIYQHDPIYQMAYAKALFSCAVQTGDFVGHPSLNGPLETSGT